MEHKLIPINDESYKNAEEALKEIKWASSVEFFIEMYNNQTIARSNTIKNIVKVIEDNFKNIIVISNTIVFISEEEISFNNTFELLAYWKVIFKLKRVALEMLDSGYSLDTKMIFTNNSVGYPQIEYMEEKEDDIEITLKPFGVEKLFQKESTLTQNILLSKFLEKYSDDEQYAIEISNIIDINLDFIYNLENEIVSKTFR